MRRVRDPEHWLRCVGFAIVAVIIVLLILSSCSQATPFDGMLAQKCRTTNDLIAHRVARFEDYEFAVAECKRVGVPLRKRNP